MFARQGLLWQAKNMSESLRYPIDPVGIAGSNGHDPAWHGCKASAHDMSLVCMLGTPTTIPAGYVLAIRLEVLSGAVLRCAESSRKRYCQWMEARAAACDACVWGLARVVGWPHKAADVPDARDVRARTSLLASSSSTQTVCLLWLHGPG